MSDTDPAGVQAVAPEGAPEPPAEPVAAPVASRELAVRPPSREVLMPLETESVIAGMEAYQAMLPRLLNADDYQDAGGGRKFVKKSGWRKIARAFNLSTEIIRVNIERAPDGSPERAEAIVRAIAPNGQTSDGDGYCDATESRFEKPKGRAKLENDLRTTATTRAKNRAISDLVGMGAVSAEEVEGGAGDGPAFGPAATEEKQAAMHRALAFLLDLGEGPNDHLATQAFNAIGMHFDYIPDAASRAIRLVAVTLKSAIDTRDSTGAQDPEPDAPAPEPEPDPAPADEPEPVIDGTATDVDPDIQRLADEF